MFWTELTGDEFPQAVAAASQVCLVPLSCIERHAHHLPLGTDMFIGREICRRAAALEPAIIFPDLVFTQILEARHQPGVIALEPELLLRLLDNVCREVARNGLTKIVLVSAHGGNNHLIRYFAQSQLASRRDYVVYVMEPGVLPEDRAIVETQWESTYDGHAGESETSQILAIQPALARLDRIPSAPEGMPLKRLQALREAGVYTGIWWYSDHPTHYAGDGRPATAAKGERELDAHGRALASAVRIIKQDCVTKALQDEFYAAAARHRRGVENDGNWEANPT